MPRFVGRDQELIDLKKQLKQSQKLAISTLTGMGGIGKTELARQFGWQQWREKAYPGGICWLNVAESDGGFIGTSILDFARVHLKLTLPDEGELDVKIRYCWQNWLAGNVLIIFDDVRDYQQIRDYLPPQEDKRFQVLITTRKEYLSATIATFRVEVLKEKDALDLLRSYLVDNRIDTQIEAAKLLCQDLGYLPLALELVARLLVRRQDWKISKIREKLAEKGLDEPILDKNPKFHGEMTAERGLKAAFNLSWEELHSEPEAQILALYLSLFALAPFPKEMILDLFPDEDGDTVEEWLTDSLVHLSLVQDKGDGWYEIHPLLRRYFRDKLEASPHAEPAKRRYCGIMAKKSAEMPQDTTVEIVEEFKPFLLHLQASVGEYPQYIADEDLVWSYTGLARYYNGQGLYAIAEPYCQDCLTATRTHLGDNHPDVATSLNNLALLYDYQGRYTEAEPLYLEALDLRKRLLGDNHPDVATSLNNLAGLYYSQGRYTEAEPLFLEALDLRKRLLGDNHPDVAQSLNNLAGLYRSQGRYTEAEPLCLEALDLTKRLLGDNHPDVANSLNNLAYLYDYQGRYTEAEPLYLEALDLRKRLLGDNHPHVATSLNNLAALYKSQGRYTEAEPLYLEALDLRKRLLGDNHPHVALSLNNLAGLYRSQGRYTEAEPLLLEALDLRKRLLGDNHPDVANSLNNLANLYKSQGRYTEAEPLYLEALDLCKRLLGDNHPDVALSLNNLAALYYSQGRYTEAEPLYLEAINIATQALGENHPHTQTFYQNYLRMLSQLPEAELRQRFPDEVVEMLKPKPPHP
ncbi:MAG: tetratricopeptide repeat protein [Microcystis flos-aquae TF09]|uniref:Tetratricopeptide repeat protein n=1 Tax=Microcystis flos-aquae TF09 TaxID=2060473 RepID=A0A3E0L675_9CHRO|nr:MAG: tetratricopeptide repeat protein [Microcystis flos-aquae TF09]